jgi:hypothetical protein
MCNQSPLHRIVMHVFNFFVVLLLTPDVHIVPPPVSDAKVRVMMHGGRQFKPLQHLFAPWDGQVLTEIAENEVGGAFRKLLHDLRRVRQGTRPDGQVIVLGHQHITEDLEAQFGPEVVGGLNEFALEAVGVKNARSPISAGSKVRSMILALEVLQALHGRSLHDRRGDMYKRLCVPPNQRDTVWGRIHKRRCMRHPRIV